MRGDSSLPSLVKLLRQANAVAVEHGLKCEPFSPEAIRSPADSYLRKLIRVAFLAPDIQQAIVSGHVPAGLTAKRLIDRPIPLDWHDQRQAFGFQP